MKCSSISQVHRFNVTLQFYNYEATLFQFSILFKNLINIPHSFIQFLIMSVCQLLLITTYSCTLNFFIYLSLVLFTCRAPLGISVIYGRCWLSAISHFHATKALVLPWREENIGWLCVVRSDNLVIIFFSIFFR